MNKNKLKLHTDNSSFTCAVLSRIENDAVVPHAAWKFMCMNCLVWAAWALTVIFGAVSVAVLIYMGDYARFALYEATHETPLSFFIGVFPYIWFVTFVSMGVFAYYNMRHTKSGYKYPMWQLFGSSVLCSIAGGVILQIFGVGYIIDTQLAKSMPVYRSLEHSEERMWQNPSEGRLLGTFTAMDENDELYVFHSSDKGTWNIQTKELRDVDRQLLSSGSVVRVLGTTTNQANKQFHACGVFPWMFDKNVTLKDMKKDRRVFVERMYEHMETGDRLQGLEKEVFKEEQDMPFEEMSICANLSVVKRMKF